jgi:predicted  nucleic acid-binding Zn-ribbon protein
MPTSIDPQPHEDELECARCGEYFFYELRRCPNCGVNIYEPEDEVDEESDISMQSTPTHKGGVLTSLIGFLRRIFGKSDLAEELFATSKEQTDLYNDLLRKVGGDPATVERLISFESKRFTYGNRSEWIKQAIWRWERDNK